MSCILSINGNIEKANCNMQTAEFSVIRKTRLLFFICCKGWRDFGAVVSLKKKYDRLKRSLYYFSTIVVL